MNKKLRRTRPGLGAYLTATILLALYGSPLIFLILGSGQQAGTIPSLSEESLISFNFDNYIAYFVEYGNEQSLINSLVIALGTTFFVMLFALPTAYWLSRLTQTWSSILLLFTVFLQMVPAASVVIPLYKVLAAWGLLGDTIGVILSLSGTLLPWALLLLGPYFRVIPRELGEAASVDGAGTFRQFWNVALPLTRNGSITIALLTFMVSWGDFIYSVNLLTKQALYPASASIIGYVNAYSVDWPGLMAASIITAIPILVIFLIFQRRLTEGLSMGAVKG